MKKNIVCLLAFLLFALPAIGQSMMRDNGLHRVYLFGNLVDLADVDPFLHALDRNLQAEKQAFSIVVTGDFIEGLITAGGEEQSVENAKKLVQLIGNYPEGKLVCIPGDRDWDSSHKAGYESVRQLEKALKFFAAQNNITNFYWPVKDACPGPFNLTIDEHVELIALNSQWWNHPHDKPVPSDASCKYATQQDIDEALNDLIDEHSDKNILIAGHHPIRSAGNYGGRFSFGDHFKPFPVIGSFKRAYQANVGGPKDLANHRLEPFIRMMENSIFLNHNLIYVAAHERNQQIMNINDHYFINSGALANPAYAGADYTTKFKARKNGVIRISYFKDGTVSSAFMEYRAAEKILTPVEYIMLFNSACNTNNTIDAGIQNLNYVPCAEQYPKSATDDLIDINEPIMQAANKKYRKRKFGRFWIGTDYRDDWSTPVQINYLNLDTVAGGLQATKRGGGRQTYSLKLLSRSGERFTFRSVDKDPSKALPHNLRKTIVGKVYQDQTSSQQPYGALIIADLLNHLDILHATPRLYSLPDVAALGPFREQFGGMLGTLEEAPGKKNAAGAYFANADDILKSNKFFRKMYKNKSHQLKTDEFVRARLFDIWVGDWSKHEDNWKWAAFRQGKKTIYRPIPRDRDMVFCQWDGVLPSLADLPFAAPNTESFDHKIKGFKSLVFQAKYMDRFLLSETPKAEFLLQAKFIQEQINDEEITTAVQQLPKASYGHSGEKIISKLKQRKKDLVRYAEKYYDWLNKEVEVTGTNNRDIFEIESLEQGRVRLSIVGKKHQAGNKHSFYERIFIPEETKQLRIYGLNEDDIFKFKNQYHSPIELILLGGKGTDDYLLNGSAKNVKIYEPDTIHNNVISKRILKKHHNKEIYDYDRNRLKFNSWIPSLLLSYTSYQGLIFGAGNTWTRQRWDKKDYASKHSISANISSKGDMGFTYSARWAEVIRKWNVLADLVVANPEYYNTFYGLGNEAIADLDLEANDFYVANYNQYKAMIGISRPFWQRSEFALQTGFGAYNSSPDDNSILDINRAAIEGASGTLLAIPTVSALDIDFRNHGVFPTDGVRLSIRAENFTGLNKAKRNYGKLHGELAYYLSSRSKKKVTLGLKIAGTKGYGTIPYYHQSSLGNNNGLRGHPGNRFTGHSMFYFNGEIRLELLDRMIAYVPLKAGLIGFYDTGRVFHESDPDRGKSNFKSGYGGGFYLVPFSRSFAFSFIMGWSDERSFYPAVTLGTFLN